MRNKKGTTTPFLRLKTVLQSSHAKLVSQVPGSLAKLDTHASAQCVKKLMVRGLIYKYTSTCTQTIFSAARQNDFREFNHGCSPKMHRPWSLRKEQRLLFESL
ncbi:uncharacterized protein LOC141532849 [Cotesia typhae]|uniref:uncharacterized protein LOC141532849 n=1 Tax=Cotesia typhae TaxID=2053667 RepID=UPI003D698916